jgi:hypothetical protein
MHVLVTFQNMFKIYKLLVCCFGSVMELVQMVAFYWLYNAND